MADPRVGPLEDQVDRLETLIEIVMLPMAFLVGVLALGGVIGVVFSIRDQRRVSQLHELAVGSEMATQRRTEQSFTAFLEGSQKTLNLVNDTLELAKQATESERHALERKASAGLRTVEEKAEDLVLRVAKTDDYDLLLDVRDNRVELERIAAELGRLETYRQLQEDIELPPYCRFIQGIQEFLDDDTRKALRTLRASTEELLKPQLQRMALYWSAKFTIALGEYDDARALLTRAVAESKETRIAGFEFQRLLHEVNFYDFADSHPDASPLERYGRLAPAIDALGELAPELAERTKDDDRQHPNHEMTATRANIFMWIAYDGDNLVEPLADRLKTRGIDIKTLHAAKPTELDDEDRMRGWAVWKAEDLYPEAEELHDDEADVDFALRLGRVESDFAIGSPRPEAYPMLERHAIDDQRREHREHRHTIELAQIALIAEARVLHFARPDSIEGHNAVRGLGDAMRELTRAVLTAPHDTVTAFSHLQRRDLSLKEFEDEAEELEKQALAEWAQRQPEPKSQPDSESESGGAGAATEEGDGP